MMKKQPILVFIIFACVLAGFLYRIKLALLFPHLPIFDEAAYIDFAQKINTVFWEADCCARTYGYPLFLAIVFKFFGNNNLAAVITIQALLDASVALILFYLSLVIFKNRLWAWTTFLLYLINPLTSSYTGLYLSEIWGMFLLVLALYLFIKSESLISRFFFGLLLGWFTFTRIMFWWWTIAYLLVLLVINIFFRKKSTAKVLPIFLGFILTLIYPTVANWKIYKTRSPLPIIPVYYLDFYYSLKISRYPTIIKEIYTEIPLEMRNEYWSILSETGGNKDIFLTYAKPKIEKALDYIVKNPFPFAFSRVRNMFYLWDKSNLYYYDDPFLPRDKPIIRVGNIIFLSLVVFGITILLRKTKKSKEEKHLLLFALSLFVYLTLPFSLLTPEERHTLVVYPILMLFVPLGFYSLMGLLRKILRKSED